MIIELLLLSLNAISWEDHSPISPILLEHGLINVAKCFIDGMIKEIKNISFLFPGIGSITTFIFRLKNSQREAMRNASRCGHLELGMNDKIVTGDVKRRNDPSLVRKVENDSTFDRPHGYTFGDIFIQDEIYQ